MLSNVFKSDYKLIADACVIAQTEMNKNANIGLKAIAPKYDDDRAHSIVWDMAQRDLNSFKQAYPAYTDNFYQSTVDEAVKANVDFQWKSGLEPKVTRLAKYDCCKWCQSLEGTYRYEDVSDSGNDVWRRHRNCRCLIVYAPRKGKAVDVKTRKPVDSEELKRRLEFGSQSKISLSGKTREKLFELRMKDLDIAKPKDLENEFADYLPLDLRKLQRKSLIEIFENTKETGFEYMVIFADGKIVKGPYTSGIYKRVYFTLENIKGNDIQLLHSHTNCSLLSLQDLTRLSIDRVSSVGNVNNVGDVYIVSIGNGIKASEKEIREIYSTIYTDVVNDLKFKLTEYNPREKTYILEKEAFYRLTKHFEWKVQGGNLYD
ncbi:MAG: hypothetical protein GX914_02600 [Erysipelotrichia bacterium]|nr:hypothetical protein [Erysipelotrichia bacterium]